MEGWHIGIDVGGTHTDLVAVDWSTGQVVTEKVPSVPSDPAQGLIDAVQAFLKKTGEPAGKIASLFHGTTVATNALVQLNGVSTGLLITRGMRAVYEGERSRRPMASSETVNLRFQKRPLLASQWLTEEIQERIAFDGRMVTPLDEDAAREAVRCLQKKGAASLAVCLLFSFMNPRHEQRLREIIQEEMPGCRASLSSEVLPMIREYQRLSTTVVDAYVGPIVEQYLRRIVLRAREIGIDTPSFFIMQSSGGIMHIGVGAKYPVQTALSGPAAGGMAAAYLTAAAALGDYVVSYDMGGTSTDVSLIIKGRIALTREGTIGQQDISIPTRDIRTIGAGGGTVAWINPDGILKVGPHSAGADPGPACFDKGGKAPTVTDANLLLGYLNPDNFLGGRMGVRPSLAEEAVSGLARRLGMDVTAASDAVLRLVENAMEVEIRICIMEKGYDPRVFTLVAFGGAGPLHAAQMLKNLGIKSLLIPRFPGITSAMGLLMTNIEHHYMQSYLRPLKSCPLEDLNNLFAHLEQKAAEDARLCGYDLRDLRFIRQMDLRYAGQGYELTVPVPERPLREEDRLLVRQAFDAEHLRIYSHNAPDIDVEVVNLGLLAVKSVPRFPLAEYPLGGTSPDAALTGRRRVFFREVGWVEEAPVYDRVRLTNGNCLAGPAIIEQEDATLVICPGQVGNVDRYHNITVQLEEAVR